MRSAGRNRSWSITPLPGVVRNEVLRPVQADLAIVKTYWQGLGDLQRWTKREAFREAPANTPPPEAFAGKSVLDDPRGRHPGGGERDGLGLLVRRLVPGADREFNGRGRWS